MEWVEEKVEGMLERVPSYVWDGETLPVPVEDIAESRFGLHVCERDDLQAAPGAPPLEPGQTLSGLLLADRGEIWVNRSEAEEWPPRKRFTICHELGHWCMHRGAGGRVYCRSSATDSDAQKGGDVVGRPRLPPAEEEANAFAAALLIPAPLLRKEYERYRRDGDFFRLCRVFDASGAAMGRRLHAVI